MFRSSSTGEGLDPKLQALWDSVSRDVFGPDQDIYQLDFATIERRAREVGRRVARQLAEPAAARLAQTAHEPQPCPDCQRPCAGSIQARRLITQDGPIKLQEAQHPCPRCRRAFSPNRSSQRLNHRRYSPATQVRAVRTATATRSFEEAAKVLRINGDLTISPRHLQTFRKEVGGERVAERRGRTDADRRRPLNTPGKPANPPIPLAVVMVDGGRMQTRQPGRGPGVHQAAGARARRRSSCG